MSHNSLKDFSVDIWLCYGSFFYGFESSLHALKDEGLSLSLKSQSEEESSQIESFFDGIIEKPKGLLRVELRIFGPDKVFKRLKMDAPIYLFTDMAPRAIEKSAYSTVLHLFSVQGISPSNTDSWSKFRRQFNHDNSQ